MKSQDAIIEERILTFFIFAMQVYSKVCEELVTFAPSHQGEAEQLKGFLSKILVHSGSAYQLYEGLTGYLTDSEEHLPFKQPFYNDDGDFQELGRL